MRRTSAMMVMRMVAIGADPPHVVVMSRLRRAGVALIADDPGAVFAELTIHRRLPVADLADAVAKRVKHLGMVTQIERLDKLDLRTETGEGLGLLVDALDQDAGKQEVRKHDNAPEPEARTARQGRVDARMGDAAKGDLCPAEPHSFPQHARELGNVGTGVGVLGAAPND